MDEGRRPAGVPDRRRAGTCGLGPPDRPPGRARRGARVRGSGRLRGGGRYLPACSPGPRSAWTSPAIAVIACGWTSACHARVPRDCSSSASIRWTRPSRAVRGGVIISVTGGSHRPRYLVPHRRPGTVAHVAYLPPGAQTAAQPATAATTATPATAASGLKNCQSHWHIDWQTPRPGVPATTRCAVNVLLTPVGAARRDSRRLAPLDPDETPLTRPPRHLPMDLPMRHIAGAARRLPHQRHLMRQPVIRVGRVGLEPTTGGL